MYFVSTSHELSDVSPTLHFTPANQIQRRMLLVINVARNDAVYDNLDVAITKEVNAMTESYQICYGKLSSLARSQYEAIRIIIGNCQRPEFWWIMDEKILECNQ